MNNSTDINSTQIASMQQGLLQESLTFKVFKLALQVAIALFGILGNILVCVVVYKTPSMRTVMYSFISSLAIADLGVLLVNFPLIVVKQQMPFSWPFGEAFCLYIYPATDIFFGASIWSVAVIAIQRYRNIASPKFRRGELSKAAVMCVLIAVWLVSFIIVGLPMFFITKYSSMYTACYPQWPKDNGLVLMQAYSTTLTVYLYILPLAVIVFTYFAIARRLRQSNDFLKYVSRHGDLSAPRRDSAYDRKLAMLKSNRKAQRILTPLVVLFAISMFPLNLLRVTVAFYPALAQWSYYLSSFYVVITFTIANSSINPIVYTCVSKEFRMAVKRLRSQIRERTYVPEKQYTLSNFQLERSKSKSKVKKGSIYGLSITAKKP